MDALCELEALLKETSICPSPIIDVGVQDTVKLITKRSIGYIVCAVLINDQNEVLMMQEAKSSCMEQWYLPAGRMETNEHIGEGAQREVLEETGLEFEPTTLLAVEMAAGSWYRFTLYGKVIGGSLKTFDQRDKESLQARWTPLHVIHGEQTPDLRMRARDVIPLIDIGMKHHMSSHPHSNILPVLNPHQGLYLRAVFIQHHQDSLQVCIGQDPAGHLPMASISIIDESIYITGAIARLTQHIFGKMSCGKIYGLLAIEHNGKPSAAHDGMCLTLLIENPQPISNSSFKWCDATEDMKKAIEDKCQEGQIVPFLSLR